MRIFFTEKSSLEFRARANCSPYGAGDMSSRKITSDSGICLSAGKQKSKIPVRDSRSSSDSEHSSDEESGHARRYSKRQSRIPVLASRQNSGSDSSEEDHGRSKPTMTDSGADFILLLFKN